MQYIIVRMAIIAFVASTMVPLVTAATRYVSPVSRKPTPPYDSWATAAKSIQTAISAAQIGDDIVVTNGVYPEGVVVRKAVLLRSVNGPRATVIEGQNGPCVVLADDAVLSGFTLTKAIVGGVRSGDNGPYGVPGTGVVTNCIITGNSGGYGGGIYGGKAFNCLIASNTAMWFGGGAYQSALHNCVLIGNSAGEAGGATGGPFYHCTVIGNKAFAVPSDLGSYSYIGEVGGLSGAFYNCIVLSNYSAYYGLANYNSSGYSINYSCTAPLPAGLGNINQDPRFINAADGNLRLRLDSPCIGAGSTNYSQGVDLDGQPWLNPPAMGAYQPLATTNILTVGIEAAYTQVSTNFSIPFAAIYSRPLVSNVWDFGDGTFLTNQLTVQHAWTVPGTCRVGLTAYADGYPSGVSTSIVVTVRNDIYYVDAASGQPIAPYQSWETAAPSIQAAIRAGSHPGRLILVTNGVYATDGGDESYQYGPVAWALFWIGNRVNFSNCVVRSVNGPAVTVIEGRRGGRCAKVGKGGVLSGFTLRKGDLVSGDVPSNFDYRGGIVGGAACDPSGVLENCVIVQNTSNLRSVVSGGRLYNCTVTGNEGGGVADSTLFNCIVYGNTHFNYVGDCVFQYCCASPLPAGEGNIAEDPRFLNAPGQDYRLSPASPCIDAGTGLAGAIPADVLLGHPILDGNGDGIARIDMGALEFNPGDLGLSDPRILSGVMLSPNGPFQLRLRGAAGVACRLEFSTNLPHWIPLLTTNLPADVWEWPIPPSTPVAPPYGFYRFRLGTPGTNLLSTQGNFPCPGTAYDVAVAGNYAYVAGGNWTGNNTAGGVLVVDVSNPAQPALAGRYAAGGIARGVSVVGRYAYVTDETAGLLVIDISNPAQPVKVGVCGTRCMASGAAVAGNYAYMATCSGLEIIDVSSPANPVRVGGCDIADGGANKAVAVAGNHAFLVSEYYALSIIDVSNPAQPVRAGGYSGNGVYNAGVAAVGNYACVTENQAFLPWSPPSGKLQLIDVSNPTQPVVRGEYQAGGYAGAVAVAGKYAYVADGGAVVLLDVSNPASPLLKDRYETAAGANAIAVAGNLILVAGGTEGLILLERKAETAETP